MKYKKVRISLFLHLILITFSCTHTPGITIKKDIKEVIPISEWSMIGPFTFDSLTQHPSTTFNNHDLDQYKINEDNISIRDLKKLNNLFKTIHLYNENGKIELIKQIKDDHRDKSNFYLFSIIECKKEMDVVFLSDGSRNYKLWMNGQKLIHIENKLNCAKVGDRITPVSLKKGKNLLFAKVGRGSNNVSCELILALASMDIGKKVFCKNYSSDFIENPIVSDSLALYMGPYKKGSLVISQNNGNSLLNFEFELDEGINYVTFNVSSLQKDTFYKARLQIDNNTLEEYFYLGNLSKRINSFPQNPPISKIQPSDYFAGLDRIKFLDTLTIDTSSKYEIKFYDKNKVFYSYHFTNFISCEEKKGGTFIKSYNSKADSSLNYFLFSIGKNALSKKKVPIIIIMPYALLDSSFIKGWYISNLDQIEIDSRMADYSGFALAWPNINNEKYYPKKGIEDILEILQSLDDNYPIDYENIYLLGDCFGGARSIIYAGKKPELFAGLAVFGPITLTGDGDNVPIDYVDKLQNVPIFIQHGELDRVSPIVNSLEFIKKANQNNIYPVFFKSKIGHVEFSKDYRSPAFQFFDSLYSIANQYEKVINKVKE